MIQPFLNRVLVKPFPSDEVTGGGIFVPENARERNNKATVIAVGEGTKKSPMQFNTGDVIYHIKEAGDAVIENGEMLFIINDVDVLAFD